MSPPRPGNSDFTDDEMAALPVLHRTAEEALEDLMSEPMAEMQDFKTRTVQFWWCPDTGWGYEVVWSRGQWWREPNGARRDRILPGGFIGDWDN